MKILTASEQLAKDKHDKEWYDWYWHTPDDKCQHNWEPDTDYAKRLKQSFEDFTKKKQSVKQNSPPSKTQNHH
jgi:hypothetical protein